MEALKYWERANTSAQLINEELQARGKKPVPPSWMYLATIGALTLAKYNFVVYTDVAVLVTDSLTSPMMYMNTRGIPTNHCSTMRLQGITSRESVLCGMLFS